MVKGLHFSDFSDTKKLGNINYLPYLIDNWIDKNIPSFGCGWSSYTISLRIRNWSWFFQFIPILRTEKRINSLWDQFIWLSNNKENLFILENVNKYIENLEKKFNQ